MMTVMAMVMVMIMVKIEEVVLEKPEAHKKIKNDATKFATKIMESSLRQRLLM